MLMNRSLSREMAFLLLFEYVIKGDESAEEIFENAVEYPNFKESPYTKHIFFGTIENFKAVSEVVDNCLKGWKKERISYVSRAILYLSTFEMMSVEDVPYKVAIDEAVDLSKKYDDEKTYTFINGVLNAVAEALDLK